MAKKKKEVAEEATKAAEVKESKSKETKGDVTKVKEKMTMKPKVIEETITKVDLSKSPEEEVEEKKEEILEEAKEEVKEEVKEEAKTEEKPIIEEVTNEEPTKVEEKVEELAEQAEEAIAEAEATGKELPENIQKLMNFMEDTGGDLEDYVRINQDYSKLDNQTLLYEYYKQTKPHLSHDEIEFLMDDTFSYDEEADEERDIKRKKLALKEQVASAKSHLDGLKSKYYSEVKAGSKLTPEQQEAVNFYNSYKNESQEQQKLEEKAKTNFLNRTNKFFGDQFKGFEYNVGEKKFRLNVNDVNKVKQTQSDLNNFIGKFLDENSLMTDEAGYHKSLYTAMNPDIIANHFYEQGRADAMKDSAAKSKNVSMEPRQSFNEDTNSGGVKVRTLNDDGPDYKFKIKQK